MEAKEGAITKGYFGSPTISPSNFIDSQEELNLVDELGKIQHEKDAIPLVRTFIANYQEWAIFALQHRRKSHNEDSLHRKYKFYEIHFLKLFLNSFQIKIFFMQTILQWKKYKRSQEFLDKIQSQNVDATVTIVDDVVMINGKPANESTEDMILFCSKIRQIDYIRYSMVEFTWALIERFLPDHPVHESVNELKETMQPTLGQVLCKY